MQKYVSRPIVGRPLTNRPGVAAERRGILRVQDESVLLGSVCPFDIRRTPYENKLTIERVNDRMRLGDALGGQLERPARRLVPA